MGGTGYMGSLPKGEGQTHAHLSSTQARALIQQGTISTLTTGLSQGEPQAAAGPKRAKSSEQGKPIQLQLRDFMHVKADVGHTFLRGQAAPRSKPQASQVYELRQQTA